MALFLQDVLTTLYEVSLKFQKEKSEVPNIYYNGKSGRVKFCPGELISKLLTRIGEWHQNLSEKTATSVVNRCGVSIKQYI